MVSVRVGANVFEEEWRGESFSPSVAQKMWANTAA